MNNNFRFILNTKTSKYFGTRRLFFDDLSIDFKEQGCFVRQDIYNKYKDFDVAIVKSSDFEVDNILKQNKNILIGLVHPSDITLALLRETQNADFVISGSIEERDYYLKYNPNIFVLPHIEKNWNKIKKHENKDEIIIGYHGNKQHLEALYPRVSNALEVLSKKYNIKLKAIYNIEKTGKWKKGRPNIKIMDTQWNYNTLANELLECDIGIAPSFLPIKDDKKNKFINILDKRKNVFTGNKNDYLLRYKNSTNAGRTFVFIQLGIPVVADMTPENCQILFHGINGYVVNSMEGWCDSLGLLMKSYLLRKKISKNALYFFNKYYNRNDYVDCLLKYIKKLSFEKKKGILKKRDLICVPKFSKNKIITKRNIKKLLKNIKK